MFNWSHVLLFPILVIRSISANLVIVTTHNPVDNPKEDGRSDLFIANENSSQLPVKVHDLNIQASIRSRYSKTVVFSRIGNPDLKAQETFFTVVLPETAFISSFILEVDGKNFQAYVQEKEKAKNEYTEAVRQGLTAGYVAVSVRDSNTFTVNINLEPQKKVTFNLTYEELLSRRRNLYEQAITIDPQQVVQIFTLKACIYETSRITTLKIPDIRKDPENDVLATTNNLAEIKILSATSACISYSPSPKQQQQISELGVKGQFLIQYDIKRELDAGEIYVLDGYFVHFFSPQNLIPLRKHVVFILDTSGSMIDRRIQQLKDAMNTILTDLREDDYFNILQFSTFVQHWTPDSKPHQVVSRGRFPVFDSEEHTEKVLLVESISAYKATPKNIKIAKAYINAMVADGSTNIYEALLDGLKLVGKHLTGEKIQSMVIFLTDGEPTIGVTDTEKIIAKISDVNNQSQIAIFSLGFGNEADYQFLKKLSLKNHAFARKIYEASDADIQLKGFYNEIASPLLSNLTFHYLDEQVDKQTITQSRFGTYYGGSELVVSGKLNDMISGNQFTNVRVDAQSRDESLVLDKIRYPQWCWLYPDLLPKGFDAKPQDVAPANTSYGKIEDSRFFVPYPTCPPIPNPTAAPTAIPTTTGKFVERLWAYLTIKQLLDKDTMNKSIEDVPKSETPNERALRLALKYGFVTPLTSLVVIKPNTTISTSHNEAIETDLPGSYSIIKTRTLKFYAPKARMSSIKRIGVSPDGLLGEQSFTFLPKGGMTQYDSTGDMAVQDSADGSSDAGDVPQMGAFGGVYRAPLPLAAPPTTLAPTSAHLTATTPTFLTLSDIKWLAQHSTYDGQLMILRNNVTTHYKLGVSQVDETFRSCQIGQTSGNCRYLNYCILQEIVNDFDLYVSHYFCEITGEFAGICCV